MNKRRHIISIQDISCLGRCSQTVALPIISSFGIETTIIPNAILSTHTYQFNDYVVLDLTKQMVKISDHLLSLGLNYNCLYTGYMCSKNQINKVIKIINNFKNNVDLVVVDPAMADNGKLYKGFDDDFVLNMKKLCKKADIIVPNITEAIMLLDESVSYEIQTKEDIEKIMKGFIKNRIEKVVLTSVSFDKDKIGVAILNNGKIDYYFKDRLVSYHGSGDVFSSVLVANITNGVSLYDSVVKAADFVYDCINETLKNNRETKYGLDFEIVLEKQKTQK